MTENDNITTTNILYTWENIMYFCCVHAHGIMVWIDVYAWQFSVNFVNHNRDKSDADLKREYPPSENISNKDSNYRKGQTNWFLY